MEERSVEVEREKQWRKTERTVATSLLFSIHSRTKKKKWKAKAGKRKE